MNMISNVNTLMCTLHVSHITKQPYTFGLRIHHVEHSNTFCHVTVSLGCGNGQDIICCKKLP